jgi:acyl carrier protein
MLEHQPSFRTALMLRIWEEVFHIDHLDEDADFFALGGDSLKALRILSLVGHATGKTVPMRLLFDAPTIKAFTGVLEEEKYFLPPYIPIRSRRSLRLDQSSALSLWVWFVMLLRYRE